jgi:hypothetical protein
MRAALKSGHSLIDLMGLRQRLAELGYERQDSPPQRLPPTEFVH